MKFTARDVRDPEPLEDFGILAAPDDFGFQRSEETGQIVQHVALKADRDCSCLMLPLSGEVGKMLIRMGGKIRGRDLYHGEDGENFGLEREPHITILYGITDSLERVREVLEDFSSLEARLMGVSLFENGEFDVLKVDVDSEDLRKLNRALRDRVSYEETHPHYTPHATIAYLKPGEGGKYVKAFQSFGPIHMVSHEVLFSDESRKKTLVSLLDEEDVIKFDPNQPRYPAGDERGGQWRDSGPGSAAFKRWFGNSQIVDEKGNPRIMYHGTKAEITEFTYDRGRGIRDPELEIHFFHKDPKWAGEWSVNRQIHERTSTDPSFERWREELIAESKEYWESYDEERAETDEEYVTEFLANDPKKKLWRAEESAGANIIPVYLKVEKLLDPRKEWENFAPFFEEKLGRFDERDQWFAKNGGWSYWEHTEVVKEMKRRGFDGVLIAEDAGSHAPLRPTPDSPSLPDKEFGTVAVFSGLQVKSAFGNVGTYDPESRTITKFDPSQPRDERGRWTDTGASTRDKARLVDSGDPEDLGNAMAAASLQWPRDRYGFRRGDRDIERFRKGWSDKAHGPAMVPRKEDPEFYERVDEAIEEEFGENEKFKSFVEAGGPVAITVLRGEGVTNRDMDTRGGGSEMIGLNLRINHSVKDKFKPNVGKPKPGDFTVGNDSLNTILRHEYGHAFWNHAMSKGLRQEFFKRVENIRVISGYAETLTDEIFPEALTLITSDYDRSEYPKWVGELDDWMTSTLSEKVHRL